MNVINVMSSELGYVLEKAKKNNHVPGEIFTGCICFCKNCNAILSFVDHSKSPNHGRRFINPGLSEGKCNG